MGLVRENELTDTAFVSLVSFKILINCTIMAVQN